MPPTASLKTKLQEAGLGRKKVSFHYQASAVDFQTRLEEVYPKLKESGGFENLRRGSQTSDLVLIQPPRSGYSVPFLRDASDLGQAIAFIRPIQCSDIARGRGGGLASLVGLLAPPEKLLA